VVELANLLEYLFEVLVVLQPAAYLSDLLAAQAELARAAANRAAAIGRAPFSEHIGYPDPVLIDEGFSSEAAGSLRLLAAQLRVHSEFMRSNRQCR
jgi:hypothetical protein